METPFDSARLMIQGAKEHIADIEEAVKVFLADDNWTTFMEPDRNSPDHLVKTRCKADLPNRITLRVYDVAAYLRSALDQAAYGSAVALAGGDPKHTKFPFGDTEKDLEGEIKRGRCKDMHPDIIALVLAFKPYEAGNRPLWALNKFRNHKNHKVLMPAVAETKGFQMRHGHFKGILSRVSEWRSTSRSLTFLRIDAKAECDIDIAPDMEVVLHSSFGLSDEPAHTVLNSIAREVERVVMAIEAETSRIMAATP